MRIRTKPRRILFSRPDDQCIAVFGVELDSRELAESHGGIACFLQKRAESPGPISIVAVADKEERRIKMTGRDDTDS